MDGIKKVTIECTCMHHELDIELVEDGSLSLTIRETYDSPKNWWQAIMYRLYDVWYTLWLGRGTTMDVQIPNSEIFKLRRAIKEIEYAGAYKVKDDSKQVQSGGTLSPD